MQRPEPLWVLWDVSVYRSNQSAWFFCCWNQQGANLCGANAYPMLRQAFLDEGWGRWATRVAWSLLNWHPTHKYLWRRLCFQNDILGGAHRDITFLLQRHYARDYAHVTVGGIWCIEEVGDHHEQETGLKRDFDSNRKNWTFGSGPLLCQRFARRREETTCKRKRIKTSLVFVTIMLHVLTYVDSHKLVWNWNGVVRFVCQEIWFDKGFVI